MLTFLQFLVEALGKVFVASKNNHEKLKKLKTSIKSLLLPATESLDL